MKKTVTLSAALGITFCMNFFAGRLLPLDEYTLFQYPRYLQGIEGFFVLLGLSFGMCVCVYNLARIFLDQEVSAFVASMLTLTTIPACLILMYRVEWVPYLSWASIIGALIFIYTIYMIVQIMHNKPRKAAKKKTQKFSAFEQKLLRYLHHPSQKTS